MIHEELSGQIISSFFKVYNTLGHGFLEKVYENALMIELARSGMRAQLPESDRNRSRIAAELRAQTAIHSTDFFK